VQIKQGGNPTIRRCTIKQNKQSAVYVYENGAGTIENCDLRDNAGGAFDIASGCQVQRSENKLSLFDEVMQQFSF
jgi:parallel beta-helix repeat protein